MAEESIHFFFENISFQLKQRTQLRSWITDVVAQEGFQLGPINYIFCDDEYLHKMNVKYLDHDTLTDIITFDYTEEKSISGDLYISYTRVKENAKNRHLTVKEELHRVMVHGVLHLCGYADKSDQEAQTMRNKEDEKLAMRSF